MKLERVSNCLILNRWLPLTGNKKGEYNCLYPPIKQIKNSLRSISENLSLNNTLYEKSLQRVGRVIIILLNSQYHVFPLLILRDHRGVIGKSQNRFQPGNLFHRS